MRYISLILTPLLILFLFGCSASYKQLSNMEHRQPSNFKEHLLNEYKKRATFEAEEMHDWNSAKLYSEKALQSLENENIYPEKISFWNLPKDKINELNISFENLMSIYDDAKIYHPYNLARAISSLDCWSEQQEENWQTWDIQSCKEDFINSMHNIYQKLSKNETDLDKNKNKEIEVKINEETEVTVVTKDNKNVLRQIIYFDFDNFNLSSVSKKKIKQFVDSHKKEINEYLIVGHTDTKGTKKYNLSLSIKRANVVKELLINYGIDNNKIKILGRGENQLAIITPDETRQPANRRVEIKKNKLAFFCL